MDEGKYSARNEGPNQGQVIGEGNTINQYYGSGSDAPRSSTPTTAWNIPYLRNPVFTGRETLLQQLHDNLTRNKTAALTQAISGLGGIGKTQTAIEYSYRYRDEYRHVLWVSADSIDLIITSFLELAALLDLPEQHEQDQKLAIAAVKRWFTTHNAWLVIFDNADDLSLVEDYLPPGGKGHILLTTRAQIPGTLANGIEVEKMDEQEGMLLLLRRARVIKSDETLDRATVADRAAAQAIVQEMDGLPLALDQAGAYIEEMQCSLSSYLDRYRKRQATLLNRRGGTGKHHREPVATTWSLSFQRVEELDPMAADLLRFCAFLAPDAIPEQLIIGGSSKLGPSLKAISDDPSLLDEALGTLLRFSLARRKRDEATISVHRLVQAVLRTSLDEQTQREWAERTVRAVNAALPDVEDYSNWPLHQQYLPHIQSCGDLIDRWNFVFFQAARLCNNVGLYLTKQARYEEAEGFCQRAIAIHEQTSGPEHPHLATSLNNLATLYRDQGKYALAGPLYQRAIAISEKVLGTEHPDLATRINNLAHLYYYQGQYEQAESLYQRAIVIREKVLGSEHPNLADSLTGLVGIYSKQGQYEQAELLCQRAIAIYEKTLGPEHPYLAITFIHLANLYSDQGNYAQAEPLYQRAIAIDEKVLGPEHPKTIKHRKNHKYFLRQREKGN